METKPDPVAENPVLRLHRLVDIIFALSMVLFIISGMLTLNDAEYLTGSDSDPKGFILDQARELLTGFLVFLFMAIYWTTHLGQSKYIIRVDNAYIWINIFYLFFIAIAPLPNALSLKYGEDVYVQQFFNLNMFLIGLSGFLAWYYATQNHRLVIKQLSAREIRETNEIMLVEPLVAVIAMAVSFIYPSLWEAAMLLLPAGMVALAGKNRRSRKKENRENQPQGTS